MKDNKFLYRLAKHIFENKDTSFENTLIVLPNKRAIRFLYEYIEVKDEQAIFLPDIFSIDELVKKNILDVSLADKLPLLYTLYKSYCKIYYQHNPLNEDEQQETFSDFYFWGGILLNDFDELDKNLVNIKAFYRNIEEYKELEVSPNEYLNEEQKNLLSRFFNINFSQDDNIIKNFVKIWNCLYDIYEDFNHSLREQHIAYSGLIYRDFSQKLENKEIDLPYKYIHLAGFSVLNQCEQKIFRLLKEQYLVEFYWDFDEYYTNNISNEAGIFMRENLALFPMSDSFAKNNFNQIKNSKQQLKIIKSSYSTYSLTYIKQWLKDIDYENQNPSDIAIILLDESLIPLVLKSLPDNIKVNITMGYPFKQTLLYNNIISLVSKWIKQGLQKEKIDEDIRALAQTILDSKNEENFWQLDVLKSINENILSFVDSLDFFENRDNLSEEILMDSIKKYLNRESVDLLSDALNGIQIMGVLESRLLDFKYVLMLSCTDDNLPKISSDSSFIPFSFKEAYNMMSIKRKVGLFAYYFYRLFHTTERMDFVYTTAAGDKVQEMSRFLRQIKIEMSAFKDIEEITLQTALPFVLESKEYNFDIKDCTFLDNGLRSLSASSLNKLIDCEKKFYLSTIKGLSEEIKDDDYIRIAFGNVFHSIANEYYTQRKKNKDIPIKDLINKIVKEARTNNYDKDIQAKEYYDKQKNLNCLEDLHFKMLEKYLTDLIEMDIKEENHYLDGELSLQKDLVVDGHTVHIKSRLDRIDKDKNDNYRIVDYKTGSKATDAISSISSIFNEDYNNRKQRTGRTDYVFEILLYCWLVYNQPTFKANTKLKPVLLYLSDMTNGDLFIKQGKDKNILIYDKTINEEFEQELKRLISSLINKKQGSEYFKTPDSSTCEYCDFAILCNRKHK